MVEAALVGDVGFEVTGLIKWFDLTKGYGFIKPSGDQQGDILLHQTCVRQSGFKFASEGARVVCEAVLSQASPCANRDVAAPLALPFGIRHSSGR